MKKVFLLGLASLGLVCLFALPALTAMKAPAEPIKLEYYPKKIVMYPHSAHADYKCGQCHHEPDKDGNPQKCTTSGCHALDKEKLSFYKVIHDKTQGEVQSCVTCHKNVVAEKNGDKAYKKAMTGCAKSGCHP